MQSPDQVSSEKLRGGFYSPPALVSVCMDRLHALVQGESPIRILEPSAGDGAFIRGLADSQLEGRVGEVTAIEISAPEAAKAAAALDGVGLNGCVVTTSAVDWAVRTDDSFDVAMGNPPFVRFQFLSPAEKRSIAELAERLDIPLRQVGNLWIPVLLGALSRLRPNGAFAFIVPADCFTGISGGAAREWLLANTSRLRIDLFPPGSFPQVLQEVVVLSGKRRKNVTSASSKVSLWDHGRSSKHGWTHVTEPSRSPWTWLLLTPTQLDAFHEIEILESIRPLGATARFEVAAVTGANDYFAIDTPTVMEHQLRPWARPLLSRIRQAQGLRFTTQDHELVAQQGAKAYLLDFSADRPDPMSSPRSAGYIQDGRSMQLHLRYKTSIRTPWYRVPLVRPEPLMLSKRSHRFPRVVRNDALAVTTDTIYRGWMLPGSVGLEDDFTAGFHNSFTLLSAELEGRSFGGGVLELVPSEVARLRVPLVPGFGEELDRLDAIVRAVPDPETDAVVDETDRLLIKADIGISSDLLGVVREARAHLLDRRLARNSVDR